MRVKDCIINLLGEIIFSIVMIIFLVELNTLNKELLSRNFDNSFALLQYNNWIALKFFGVALLLFFIGCLLLVRRFRHRRECDSFEKMIMMFSAIIVIFILLILLIIFIDNPILRAVLTFVLVVLGIANAGK